MKIIKLKFLKILRLSLFAVLILSTNLKSQSIVRTDLLWATLRLYALGDGKLHVSCTLFNRFEGDTIIGDLEYKKVWISLDSLKSWTEYGYIRENNSQVFLIEKGRDYERTLCDFSKFKGDTIVTYGSDPVIPDTLEVIERDSILVQGIYRLRILVRDIHGNCSDTWIDGIGSLNGVLFTCYGGSGLPILICEFENDTLIYHNENYSKCYYSKGEIMHISKIRQISYSIFPNPISTILNIKSNLPIKVVQIFDLTGKLILSESFSQDPQLYTIDVSNLSKGCYIANIQYINLVQLSQLIIK